MPKFAVGQMVYHRTGKHSGKIVECQGDTVYIMQANGVEFDLPAADLTATPPANARNPAATEPANMSRVLTMNDITPEHQKVLSIIPQRTLQTIASLYEKRLKAGRFSALNVAQKINFIAEVTAVPYRTMKEYSDQPGTLGLMMGRGLSISLGQAT